MTSASSKPDAFVPSSKEAKDNTKDDGAIGSHSSNSQVRERETERYPVRQTSNKSFPDRVYVGGLDSCLTEDDLETFFSRYGVVSNVIIPYRNGRKDYGFVTFKSNDSVSNLLAGQGSNLTLKGKKLTVGSARKRNHWPFHSAGSWHGGNWGPHHPSRHKSNSDSYVEYQPGPAEQQKQEEEEVQPSPIYPEFDQSASPQYYQLAAPNLLTYPGAGDPGAGDPTASFQPDYSSMAYLEPAQYQLVCPIPPQPDYSDAPLQQDCFQLVQVSFGEDFQALNPAYGNYYQVQAVAFGDCYQVQPDVYGDSNPPVSVPESEQSTSQPAAPPTYCAAPSLTYPAPVPAPVPNYYIQQADANIAYQDMFGYPVYPSLYPGQLVYPGQQQQQLEPMQDFTVPTQVELPPDMGDSGYQELVESFTQLDCSTTLPPPEEPRPNDPNFVRKAVKVENGTGVEPARANRDSEKHQRTFHQGRDTARQSHGSNMQQTPYKSFGVYNGWSGQYQHSGSRVHHYPGRGGFRPRGGWGGHGQPRPFPPNTAGHKRKVVNKRVISTPEKSEKRVIMDIPKTNSYYPEDGRIRKGVPCNQRNEAQPKKMK